VTNRTVNQAKGRTGDIFNSRPVWKARTYYPGPIFYCPVKAMNVHCQLVGQSASEGHAEAEPDLKAPVDLCSMY